MITQEELKDILLYEPYTGNFYWKIHARKDILIGQKAGTINSNGRVIITYKSKKYQAHRLAWLYMMGTFPKSAIDHLNRNPLDNRWGNLRDVSLRVDSENRIDNNHVIGVRWHCNRWQAYTSRSDEGGRKQIGRYKRYEDAVAARREYEYSKGIRL